MSVGELACTYAALILADDDVEISSENITKIADAANIKMEPYWPMLFAKFLEGKDLKDMLSNVGAGGGGGGPAPAAGGAAGGDAGAAAAAPEPEPEEEEEEEVRHLCSQQQADSRRHSAVVEWPGRHALRWAKCLRLQ